MDMLGSSMIINGPAADLGAKEASRPSKKQSGSVQNPGPSTRARAQPLSIKDKISKWEGKKEPPTPEPARQTEGQENYLPPCGVERRGSEVTRTKNGLRLETESLENDSRRTARTACQDTERWPGLRQSDGQPEPSQRRGLELKPSDLRFQSDHLSVLKQVRRLEKALKDGSAGLDPQLPGTCYSPHCLPDKTEEDQRVPESPGSGGALAAGRRAHPWEDKEPGPEAPEECKGQESVYPGSRQCPPKPFINPLPKPRRTFKHAGEGDKDGSPGSSGIGFRKEKRNLPPLPSLPPPPPPLPSSPPPTSVNRRLWTGRQRPSADHR